MSWVVHPLVTEYRKSAFAVVVIAAFCAAVYAVSKELWWVFLSAVVLLAAVKDHFLPVRYTIDERGVTKTVLGFSRSWSWSRVKRVVKTEDGLLLSRYPRPHRFEATRGFYLRFGEQDPEPIVEFIKKRVGDWAS